MCQAFPDSDYYEDSAAISDFQSLALIAPCALGRTKRSACVVGCDFHHFPLIAAVSPGHLQVAVGYAPCPGLHGVSINFRRE